MFVTYVRFPVWTQPVAIFPLDVDQPVHSLPHTCVFVVTQADKCRDDITRQAGESHLVNVPDDECLLMFGPCLALLPPLLSYVFVFPVRSLQGL